jgi:hypothetical protein
MKTSNLISSYIIYAVHICYCSGHSNHETYNGSDSFDGEIRNTYRIFGVHLLENWAALGRYR